ncbi:hypothetical protein [Ilumatobacter sp.]|uniref:hypothetical protein n=1 Tax=Ilumatobacter sp. TaxID=1967498 RepID=UPI003C4416FE
MTADRDRAQVYAAELAAFDGTDLEQIVGFDAVAEAVGGVVADPWWPGLTPTVRSMRSDAMSSGTRCSVSGPDRAAVEIAIAAPQATIATGAHELAHVLAGVGHGHDATFRRAHLDVVGVITNLERPTGRGTLHIDQLQKAYEAVGLAPGERSWPEPPRLGGAIAL